MFNLKRVVREQQTSPDSLLRLATYASLKKEEKFHRDIPRNILPRLKMILGKVSKRRVGGLVEFSTKGGAGEGVRIGQFSTKKNTQNGLKSILRQTYFFSIFRGGVFTPKLNCSASTFSHATILQLLADPYHTEFAS